MAKLRLTAAILSLIVGTSNAFSISPSSAVRRPSLLQMVDGPDDGTKIASGRKEIGYDQSSGRFLETGKGAEECIPDDEYCVLDEETGQMIRLTLVEKERIFLDALQVSRSRQYFESYTLLSHLISFPNCHLNVSHIMQVGVRC